MAEGETLPKGNTSKEWTDYADKKLKKFKDYHSETNIIGQLKHPMPLADDYSKTLSNNEMQARTKAMSLKRAEQGAPSYKKGGTVRATGLAMVHKGEKVIPVRKAAERKALRKSGRR